MARVDDRAQVAEATEQRKAEHAEFLQFQTENNAAVQLIEKAKNHLSAARGEVNTHLRNPPPLETYSVLKSEAF